MFESLNRLARLIARFRYPVSLPEEVTEALGIEVSNFSSFNELIKRIIESKCSPMSLAKYMPRKEAEAAFKRATCIEQFSEKTLISYFFSEGWVEFILKFDDQSRLRRIYILHKSIQDEQGIEIPLCCSYIGKPHLRPVKVNLNSTKHYI